MKLAAPAKVNLFLHVTGKRSDGYHTLESLITFAEVADFLTITPGDALTLSTHGPMASALGDVVEDNLILKAARRLHPLAKQGATFALEKNLPLGAGLGGGSSDAAAALIALTKLWKLSLSKPELASLALEIGADVPVCLQKKSAFVKGVGEVSHTVSLPPMDAVLVYPAASLSTKAVFTAYQKPFRAPLNSPPTSIDSKEALLALLHSTHNDLEEAAAALLPAVPEALAALRGEEGCLFARMSGSGSACFGLYENKAAAEKAATRIRTAHKKQAWWVCPTRLGIP